jgi:hypothetical protein
MTDSIFSRDCNEFCWTDEHLVYVPFCVVALALYVPLAVYARPLWQCFQGDLHIRTLPLFLMVKSVFQILLITLAKTAGRQSEIIHGALFLALMTCFAGFVYRKPAFNYPRAWFWYFLGLVAVIWTGLLATINQFASAHLAFVILLFSGYGVMIVVGLW